MLEAAGEILANALDLDGAIDAVFEEASSVPEPRNVHTPEEISEYILGDFYKDFSKMHDALVELQSDLAALGIENDALDEAIDKYDQGLSAYAEMGNDKYFIAALQRDGGIQKFYEEALETEEYIRKMTEDIQADLKNRGVA